MGSYWAQQEYSFQAFATSVVGNGPISASADTLKTAAWPPNSLTATISAIDPYDSGKLAYGHDRWGILANTGSGQSEASIVSLANQVSPSMWAE